MTAPDGRVAALEALAMCGSLLATAEVLAIAGRSGLTPSVLLDVLDESSGGSHVSRHLFPEQVLTGRYAAGAALGDVQARFEAIVDEARAAGAITPMASRIVELTRVAVGQGSAASLSMISWPRSRKG